MTLRRAQVAAVAAAKNHKFSKDRQKSITLIAGQGVEGDAHRGSEVRHLYDVARNPTRPNLRQVHLIERELLDRLKKAGFDINPGELGENITTLNVRLTILRTGTLLRLGETAIVRLTGLRKPCIKIDRFRSGLKRVITGQRNGVFYMKNAVMAVVEAGGLVAPGDDILVQSTVNGAPLGCV